MKKLWIIAGVVLLSVFIYLGFYLTETYILPVISNPTIDEKPLSLDYQRAILLVQIDDMTVQNPHLLSMWVFFISNADSSQIIIKSIYPSVTDEPQTAPLARSFSISRENQLSKNFLHEVDKLKIPYNNIIILDQTAFKSIAEWITAHAINLLPILPQTIDDAQNSLVQDAAVLNEMCRYLPGKTSSRGPDPAWDSLISSHFRSDFSFDDMILLWDLLTSDQTSLQCEVIANQ